MIEKYIANLSNELSLAVKFDPLVNAVVIGGHGAIFPDISFVCEHYFGVVDGDVTWTQKNKVRISFSRDREEFNDGVQSMQADGYSFTKVKSHERMMR